MNYATFIFMHLVPMIYNIYRCRHNQYRTQSTTSTTLFKADTTNIQYRELPYLKQFSLV